MKLHKLLPLLTVACIGATLPITSCTTEPDPKPGPTPPTPGGKEFDFDKGDYKTLEPWTPEKGQDLYSIKDCLSEYVGRVKKDRFEDDFLGAQQVTKEEVLKNPEVESLHLKIFISFNNIKVSSNDEVALLSLHTIGEYGVTHRDNGVYSLSYDLTFVDVPLQLWVTGYNNWMLSAVTDIHFHQELLNDMKITGWLIEEVSKNVSVDINKDNYSENVDLFDMCCSRISMFTVNSLKNFKNKS